MHIICAKFQKHKKMFYRTFLSYIIVLLFCLCTWSCEEGENIVQIQRRIDAQKYSGGNKKNGRPEDVDTLVFASDIQRYLSNTMNDIYFWYDKIAQDVDTSLNIYDYFQAKLYSGDRWSWMESGSEYLQAESGVNTRYGMELAQPRKFYNDISLKVSYVYPNSPIDNCGITRGWTLTAIDNIDVIEMIRDNSFYSEIRKSPHDFTFLDLDSVEHTYNISSAIVNQPSILLDTIFTSSPNFPELIRPIGYMNYLSFNLYDTAHISEVMTTFKTAGIKDFILDLRYNGGGYNNVLQILGSYLAPASAEGETLLKMIHNDKFITSDKPLYIARREGSLELENLVVIGSRSTASASEALINGLQPLMNVTLIGDTTYGKPYGMYVIPYPHSKYLAPEYVFYPICFFNVNRNDIGDYIDGIIPDALIPDDLFHDFGTEEACINAAITYLTTGTLPTHSIVQDHSTKADYGATTILKSAKELPNYGRSIATIEDLSN